MQWVERAREGLARLPELRLVGEVAVTYGGQAVGSGIGFAIQLFLQRTLGPADYGILALATSIGTLSALFTDAGISHAMVRFGSRYLAEDPDRAMPRFLAALLLRLGLTLFVTAVGLVGSSWLAVSVFEKPDLIEPIVWVYLGLTSSTLYSFWMYYAQSRQRFALRSGVAVFSAVLRMSAVAALWGAALLAPTTMIMVDAAVCFTGFLVGSVLSARQLFRWDGPEIRESLGQIVPYCRFTGLLLLAEGIASELDTFMLGMFSTEDTVGMYRAAWNYGMILLFLNVSVSSVLFPKASVLSQPDEVRAFLRRVFRVTTALAICTLPLLPLVSWWIPWYESRYADAAPIFYVMYIGIVFELVIGPFGYAFFSLDRPSLLVMVAVIRMVLNGVGNFLLIPAFGAEGAAWSTVATRIVGGCIMMWAVFGLLGTRGAPRRRG